MRERERERERVEEEEYKLGGESLMTHYFEWENLMINAFTLLIFRR